MRIPLLSFLLLFPISAAALTSEQFLNYRTFVFDEVKAVVSYARDVDQNDKSSFALGIIGSSSITQSNGLGTPSVILLIARLMPSIMSLEVVSGPISRT